MIELNKHVFGQITNKEIIGSNPPAIPDTKNLLEKEFNKLIKGLELQDKNYLKKLISEQQKAKKLVNNKPGSMALSHDKIRLFNYYNEKYIQTLKEKINS